MWMMHRLTFKRSCWLRLTVGALLACPLIAPAQVLWSEREVTLEAVAGTSEPLNVSYAFKNTGDKPVTITSVTPSCGCTTAKLDKTTYQPGESGVIQVAFAVEGRVGRQIKKIVVRSDSAATPVTTLTLRAHIRELLELSPKLLLWAAGELRAPKKLTVTVAPGRLIELISAEVKGAEIGVKIEEVFSTFKKKESGVEKANGVGPNDGRAGNGEESEPRIFTVTVTPPDDGLAHRALVGLRAQDETKKLLPDEKFLVRVMANPQMDDGGVQVP